MLVALCDAYALHSQIGPTVDGARMAEVQRRYAERDMGLAPGALDPAPRLP
jgi:hypothetical protein